MHAIAPLLENLPSGHSKMPVPSALGHINPAGHGLQFGSPSNE